MKLNSNEMNTQDKINAICETEINENKTEKETNKMNFNLDMNTNENESEKETAKTFELKFDNTNKTVKDLKKEKSQIEKANELTIDKFAQVENLLNKMNSIDDTFINFLDNQKETLQVLNNFSNFRNEMETYFTSFLKNQKSILNSINSLNSHFKKNLQFIPMNNEKETEKDLEKETEKDLEKEKVITRKGLNTLQGFFAEFQKNFQGNFLGSKELTKENEKVFQALIESIDDNNADTIAESIKTFKSNFTKSNKGMLLNAKRSNKKFISALIETIEKVKEKDLTKDSKQNSIVINKAYFTDKFNLKLKELDQIIKQVNEYGKIDSQVKGSITSFIQKKNSNEINSKELVLFYEYLTNFISD